MAELPDVEEVHEIDGDDSFSDGSMDFIKSIAAQVDGFNYQKTKDKCTVPAKKALKDQSKIPVTVEPIIWP